MPSDHSREGMYSQETGTSSLSRSHAARSAVDGDELAPAHLDPCDGVERRLVEHGGELLAPVRQARPGEVGVAGSIDLAELLETPRFEGTRWMRR